MSNFDLIVWDFDGVLNRNVVKGRFVWADNLQADLGIDQAALSAFVFGSGRMRGIVRGEEDLRDVVAEFLDGHEVSPDDLLAYWFQKDALPDQDVIGWLKAHPARHVIGTNNEARRAAYIENEMGFSDLVERVFASGRLGIGKPDAAFFRHIEAWAGVIPDRILLVDDHAPNIEAVQALGWQGFHFTDETREALPQTLGL